MLVALREFDEDIADSVICRVEDQHGVQEHCAPGVLPGQEDLIARLDPTIVGRGSKSKEDENSTYQLWSRDP